MITVKHKLKTSEYMTFILYSKRSENTKFRYCRIIYIGWQYNESNSCAITLFLCAFKT